jgi:Tol biopolymer transport system component
MTQGLAFDVQPRFSPDGREVSFTSDRGGGNNIWRMPLSGGDPVAVTSEDFRLTNNAEWTPDGDYLIARKHFTGSARWVRVSCGCITAAVEVDCS